jgi:hypothetical protein
MNAYSIAQYSSAECPEIEIPSMIAVHGITGGRVCDTGCHLFNNGYCRAYKNLTRNLKASIQPTETVRAEATRRGVSINEVRRNRRKR